MKSKYNIWSPVFINTLDTLTPEVWAQESLMVLEANTTILPFVHRDFSSQVAQKGDVVHANRPGRFYSKRKGTNDNVTIQDASSSEVLVPLNQQHHVSFLIKDGEEAYTMGNLVQKYLKPQIQAIGRAIDQMLIMQQYQFLANTVGTLGTAQTKASVLALNKKLQDQKVPQEGRQVIMTSSTEADLLNIGDFTTSDKIGGVSALANGKLKSMLNLNWIQSQNNVEILGGQQTAALAINNVGGYSSGATVLTVDGAGFAGTVAGQWVLLGGKPYMITAKGVADITIAGGLQTSVADNAVITRYTGGLINNVGGYAQGWEKEIAVDTFVGDPQANQGFTIGTNLTPYGVLEQAAAYGTSILPDRPLDSAIVNNAVVGLLPAGNYNFAFHRNALAFVSRTLPEPQSNLVNSSIASYNGLGIRVTITYDGNAQGHLVTADLLCGVKVLDTNLGAVLLG